MFRTTRYLLAAYFVVGLTLLISPSAAKARRPSTVASKSYCSGKFTGNLKSDDAADFENSADGAFAGRMIDRPTGELKTARRSKTPVHVYKPLHATLPHAMKQSLKIAATQGPR